LLPEYHKRNQEKAAELLRDGQSVIIDNTNLQNWQVKPYVLVAKEVGAKILVVRCDGGYANLHGVPPDRVEAMRNGMETLDPEIALTAKAPWEK
jgi:predicted kinase